VKRALDNLGSDAHGLDLLVDRLGQEPLEQARAVLELLDSGA
jgi:hypothetical protein